MGELYQLSDYSSSKPVARNNEKESSLLSLTPSYITEQTEDLTSKFRVFLQAVVDHIPQPQLPIIDTQRLYGTATESGGRNMSAELIEACSSAISILDNCVKTLNEEDLFQSDMEFMELEASIRNLQIFLSLSDGVGLVITQLQKFFINGMSTLDFSPVASEVKRALNALRIRPNMSFALAMDISESLEAVRGENEMPGYEEIFDLLVRNFRDDSPVGDPPKESTAGNTK